MRFNCTNMPRGLSVAVTLESPHPILIRLILQADPAQTPSLVANGRLRWLEHFHLPKASLSHRVVKHKPTRPTDRWTSQVTVPLSNGAALRLSPLPLSPHSRQPETSLQTQSRAPLLPWASAQWCHLLKSPRARWAFPPSLQQGRFQKGRLVSQSSQQRFQV